MLQEIMKKEKLEIIKRTDIKKIDSAFTKYEDIDGYCHIADFEELKENEFNLNVPRYVDISESEEEIDIQKTIDELKKLRKRETRNRNSS